MVQEGGLHACFRPFLVICLTTLCLLDYKMAIIVFNIWLLLTSVGFRFGTRTLVMFTEPILAYHFLFWGTRNKCKDCLGQGSGGHREKEGGPPAGCNSSSVWTMSLEIYVPILMYKTVWNKHCTLCPIPTCRFLLTWSKNNMFIQLVAKENIVHISDTMTDKAIHNKCKSMLIVKTKTKKTHVWFCSRNKGCLLWRTFGTLLKSNNKWFTFTTLWRQITLTQYLHTRIE